MTEPRFLFRSTLPSRSGETPLAKACCVGDWCRWAPGGSNEVPACQPAMRWALILGVRAVLLRYREGLRMSEVGRQDLEAFETARRGCCAKDALTCEEALGQQRRLQLSFTPSNNAPNWISHVNYCNE